MALCGGIFNGTDSKVIDGIEFDSFGRVLNYHFLIGDNNEVKKVPAAAVIHLFDAERISQVRAYPQIQHTINDVIDRKEILALEKKKVKSISDIFCYYSNSIILTRRSLYERFSIQT